jgi:hypothetical protein
VLTRPLRWGADKSHLFVNCEGGLVVEVLGVDSSGGVGPVLRRSVAIEVNSTRVEVQWGGVYTGLPLPAATAADPLRLRFTLIAGAKLYAFWPASDKCGASGGAVAGGGPGYTSSTDEHGSCTAGK